MCSSLSLKVVWFLLDWPSSSTSPWCSPTISDAALALSGAAVAISDGGLAISGVAVATSGWRWCNFQRNAMIHRCRRVLNSCLSGQQKDCAVGAASPHRRSATADAGCDASILTLPKINDNNFAEIPGNLGWRRKFLGRKGLERQAAVQGLDRLTGDQQILRNRLGQFGSPLTILVRDSLGFVGSYAGIFCLCLSFYLTIMVPSDKAKDRSGVQALKEDCGVESPAEGWNVCRTLPGDSSLSQRS
jgi:hypothetical protein